MKHQKFLNKLSYLNINEINDFQYFINYFFQEKDLPYKKTLEYLIQFHPNYEAHYNADILHTHIYKEKHATLSKLDKLFIQLNIALDEYLAYMNLRKNNLEMQMHKIQSSILHEDFKNYEVEKEELTQKIKKSQKKNDKMYQIYYELSSIEYQYQIEHDQRKGDLNIQDMSTTFDTFWLIRKLEIYSIILSRKLMFNISFETHLIDEIIAFIPNSKFIKIPIINILYHNILLYKEPDKFKFQLFKEQIVKNKEYFSLNDLRGYYSSLENIIHKIFNQSEQYEELFQLYEIQNKLGILTIDHKIAAPLYNNIITVAIRQNKLNWVDEFIEKNKLFLSKEHHQDYYSFNKARLLFALKQYKKILPLLINIEFVNIEIKLGVKRLLSKTFYELDELTTLEHHLNSLKVFIYRHNELSEYHLTMHKLYLKYFYKLHKLAIDPNRKGLQKFMEEVKSTHSLIDKSWFIEKLQKLTNTKT